MRRGQKDESTAIIPARRDPNVQMEVARRIVLVVFGWRTRITKMDPWALWASAAPPSKSRELRRDADGLGALVQERVDGSFSQGKKAT